MTEMIKMDVSSVDENTENKILNRNVVHDFLLMCKQTEPTVPVANFRDAVRAEHNRPVLEDEDEYESSYESSYEEDYYESSSCSFDEEEMEEEELVDDEEYETSYDSSSC